jgi:hypothetical protein
MGKVRGKLSIILSLSKDQFGLFPRSQTLFGNVLVLLAKLRFALML